MPRPNHGLSRYCTTSEYGPLPFWGTQSSKGKERRALGECAARLLERERGRRGKEEGMARGSGNGDGKGRARKGRPVRARKAEAAWRLEKKKGPFILT